MVKAFLKKQNTLAAIVFFSLIILASATYTLSLSFMESAANKILAPLESVDSIQKGIIENSLFESNLKVSTLKNQYFISGKIKNYYKGVSVSYYKHYFAFSICSILFTTLLTIAGFLIANKGWNNSIPVLKSFLLTSIVLSSIFHFLPKVLNNKENLNDNIKKVSEFNNIQSDILTVSNKINQMNTIQIDSSITSNYKRISFHLNFLTTIDDSQLQSEFGDLIKQLNQN